MRADGYASKVTQFQVESLRELLSSNSTITLSSGREVTIRLSFPDGMSPPNDFQLRGYLPEFQDHAYSRWQPLGQIDNAEVIKDFDILNVKRLEDDLYSVRLPIEDEVFYLAMQQPGWLQFCELGPFDNEDIVDGTLSVTVPASATIKVIFDTGSYAASSLPFDEVNCSVFWEPDESGRIYMVTEGDVGGDSETLLTLTDLGPGRYSVWVRTNANDLATNIEGTDINSGEFKQRKYVDLTSGESETVKFQWKPFDPNAWQGDARTRVAILNPDGTAPQGKVAKITRRDDMYGDIPVHESEIADDGVIAIDGLSAKFDRGDSIWGPYTVAIDGKRLGFFTLEKTPAVQDFKFTITPGVGDLTPDFALFDVESDAVSHLSDYRGKVVLLEFWRIGCIPCLPAMEKLNSLVAKQPSEWREKVAVLALSTESDPALVLEHAKNRGWNALRHFIGEREKGAHFSKAETAYVVLAVPRAVLIDQTGKIVWRGHPDEMPGSDFISALLED